MAIDFSQVKTITIPEGSVTKITDSNGVVLWQGESGSWQTIWEGSKTCYATDATTSGIAINFAQTISGTGYTPKLRITFSLTVTDSSSSSNKGLIRYYVNSNSGTASPESPLIVDSLTEPSSITILLGGYIYYNNYSYNIYAGLWATKDTANNRISFALQADYNQPSFTPYNGKVTIKITKIEQYINN